MTTTVKQLIKYLETLSENLPVQVRREYYAGLGVGYVHEWVDLELPDLKTFSDYTDTCFVFKDALGLGGN